MRTKARFSIIYNPIFIIYNRTPIIYKGGKPEKGGKIWHFFVDFILQFILYQ